MNHQHLSPNLEVNVLGLRNFPWNYNGKSGITRYLNIAYHDNDTTGYRVAEIKIPSLYTGELDEFVGKTAIINTYVNDYNGKKDLCLYNITAK